MSKKDDEPRKIPKPKASPQNIDTGGLCNTCGEPLKNHTIVQLADCGASQN